MRKMEMTTTNYESDVMFELFIKNCISTIKKKTQEKLVVASKYVNFNLGRNTFKIYTYSQYKSF